jgi:hypothetical protein
MYYTIGKIAGWSESKPHITESEILSLQESILKFENWLESKQQLQLSKSPFEDPAFMSSDIPLQMKIVIKEYDRLNKKPKPAPPKVEKVCHITYCCCF